MELLLNSSMKTDLQSRTAITIEEWAEILPQFEELGGVLPQFEELVEDTPIWGGFFPPIPRISSTRQRGRRASISSVRG